MHARTHTHTHTHRCGVWFAILVGTLHWRNVFSTVQTVYSIVLHLNLALTGNFLHIYIFKKLHSVWFISLFTRGDLNLGPHCDMNPHESVCNSGLSPHQDRKTGRLHTHTHTYTHKRSLSLSLTHTHTRWSLWLTGTLHRRNAFSTYRTVFSMSPTPFIHKGWPLQALQEHDGKNWETEEELLLSGHQAPKLKLGLITSTWLHLIISKIFTILHHPHFCYVYTLYNLFAH